MKAYETTSQAIGVRVAACRCAAQIVSAEGGCPGAGGAGRLMALTIFFETYIASGSKLTEKTMELLKAAT